MADSSRTWDFRPSLMTKDMMEELRKLDCFRDAKVKPPQGETIPKLQAADAVVFKDFSFTAFASLQPVSSVRFLRLLRYSCIALPLMVLLL
jgi:hypothetical protein